MIYGNILESGQHQNIGGIKMPYLVIAIGFIVFVVVIIGNIKESANRRRYVSRARRTRSVKQKRAQYETGETIRVGGSLINEYGELINKERRCG